MTLSPEFVTYVAEFAFEFLRKKHEDEIGDEVGV